LAGALALCLSGVFSLSAQTLESLCREYRAHPTPARHGAILSYAAARPKDPNGALALFALGAIEVELGTARHPDAVQHLKAARSRLPNLADYVAYKLAEAETGLNQFAAVSGDLFPVWNNAVASPVAAKAALLAANASRETGHSASAVEVLRRFYSQLPQPEGDLSLAMSYEEANDRASAVVYCQRVYYQHPASPQAGTAGASLGWLKTALGAAFPPPTAAMMLDRAEKLMAAGLCAKARSEYQTLIFHLAGGDQDLARVGIGAADYAAHKIAAAAGYLKSLEVRAPEADAERLYYLVECARRMSSDGEMNSYITQLGRQYPASGWRLKALIAAGNHYAMSNQASDYLPLFRAGYETFPSDPQAGYCHWKVAWYAYLNRRSEAGDLLREHLSRFPSSSYAAAALYFLGRLAEGVQDSAAAKAYYERTVRNFPGYYYCDLAEERLRDPALAGALSSPLVREFLDGITLRKPTAAASFAPSSVTSLRLERARLLGSAALDDLAELELRYGAANSDQPHIFGLELAQMTARRGAPDRAIRMIKTLVPDYFATPFDAAPRQFWELAFPLPFRSSLVRYSQERKLDPYLVAGLIRQESEFNPKAVSPAKAYGLTQILPSTGRQLSRKLGVRRFRTTTLLQPDTNMQFGTYYLKTILDEHSGKVAPTLASYNAGGARVASWLNWADFREPAEFIETIPISETRNYVQLVLRNASLYRRIYGPEPPPAGPPDAGATKKAAKAAPGGKVARHASP
jgi:soluble lytic murein transglycosylase